MIFQKFGPKSNWGSDLERISPGVIRSEVGRPGVSHSPSGRPTSERITPGEILSELPEIATPVRFWPKFLENHRAVNLQKISRGLYIQEAHWTASPVNICNIAFFPPNGITDTKSFEGFSQKGTFS